MISCYKLRIDDDNRTNIRVFLDRYSTRYIVSFEGEENNPHFHGYIETTVEGSTIRAAIRKRWGSGNGAYSLRVIEQNPLKYLAYMIKDGDYINSGISEEVLNQAKEYDARVKQELKEKKAARRTVLQCIEDTYFKYSEEHKTHLTLDDHYISKEYIVDSILDYYAKKNILIRQFMIISLAQTLSVKYVSGFRTTFRNSILDKMV